MGTIGTFKKSGIEFTGEIITLSLQTRNVPDTKASGGNAPSHRVYVGRAEIGAAWSQRSNEGTARTCTKTREKPGGNVGPPFRFAGVLDAGRRSLQRSPSEPLLTK